MDRKEIHRKVKNLFVWQSDSETYNMPEHWKSHIDSVKNNQVFFDDCDGFALTCAELCYENNYPDDQIKLAFCQTETDTYHLVCIVEDDVLDNRQRSVWHWSLIKYKWIKSMALSEPGTWREST